MKLDKEPVYNFDKKKDTELCDVCGYTYLEKNLTVIKHPISSKIINVCRTCKSHLKKTY